MSAGYTVLYSITSVCAVIKVGGTRSRVTATYKQEAMIPYYAYNSVIKMTSLLLYAYATCILVFRL